MQAGFDRSIRCWSSIAHPSLLRVIAIDFQESHAWVCLCYPLILPREHLQKHGWQHMKRRLG